MVVKSLNLRPKRNRMMQSGGGSFFFLVKDGSYKQRTEREEMGSSDEKIYSLLVTPQTTLQDGLNIWSTGSTLSEEQVPDI